MIQRGGQMVIRMLPNVQQRTIEPLITRSVAKGTLINTDGYDIHARLPAWRHQRKTVCHGQGKYARDEDGDGHHEVHVNTMESLLLLTRAYAAPIPRGFPLWAWPRIHRSRSVAPPVQTQASGNPRFTAWWLARASPTAVPAHRSAMTMAQ